MRIMKSCLFSWLVLVFGSVFGRAASSNLVANGSFELPGNADGAPLAWQSAGNPRLRQQLARDTGHRGGHSGELICSEFSGDGPDVHAMICQVGKVSVRGGQWYRLSFWARAEAIKAGAVEIALVHTRPWSNAGLADAFVPTTEWKEYEFRFRAGLDLPAEASRLQFWFKSTGKLWLDDVTLVETELGQAWFPRVPEIGGRNLVPNSSFECGTANWGSYTWGLSGWAGNLYRLEGAVEDATAEHGNHCLRVTLGPDTTPVFYFDYYEPVRKPVRRVLAANRGWFQVTPGEELTLSAFLRAERDGAVARLAAVGAPEHVQSRSVKVSTNWRRYEFTFKPAEAFLFIAVGLDLDVSQRSQDSLWIDAVELERGGKATAYEPRAPVESFLETAVAGNQFTNAAAGLSFQVRAFNNTDGERTASGTLAVTDFFDRKTFSSHPAIRLPAHGGGALDLSGIERGRLGFFRVTWDGNGGSNSLRCAVVEPAPPQAIDSPFGFNHAYPWDFLVRLAKQAGIGWWRDWSAKWQTVEPEPGRLDFAAADLQIDRARKAAANVDVLLPFPSALWCTTAREDEVRKAAGENSYLRSRLPVAYAPKRLEDFGHYAAAVARHYAPPAMEVLNEPLYTDYALPRQFGYALKDYLALLKTAHQAIKNAAPSTLVVGGIGAHARAGLTLDFVRDGGLDLVDAFDVHLYDAARPAETFEETFESLHDLMAEHGGPKPVWITEWGCYADDDPAAVPEAVGDATMNRCRWPSERAATEHIVKFTAVTFFHGVRKIFFHAGTCGAINGPDAGGVLFEYGGAPRKMLSGVSALTRLFGTPIEEVKRVATPDGRLYIFRKPSGMVAVGWGNSEAGAKPVQLPEGVAVWDIMGNRLPGHELRLSETPVYFTGRDLKPLADKFQQ